MVGELFDGSELLIDGAVLGNERIDAFVAERERLAAGPLSATGAM